MALRDILRWPDPRLSRKCVKVGDTDVGDLVRDLFETMYDAPGRGLAAPQIGVLVRVFVMDAGWKDGEMAPRACIDPEIVAASETSETRDEGCLSIPGVTARVTRPDWIVLRYRGLDGAVHEERLEGMEATCAQHELDHLDGIVTFDRVAPEARRDLETEYEALL
ncbi:N-formylmethionyl-tRNA deformylase [Roseivivax halodurans JCM 10272]|uniref:Peptide deformylase n=1 Tax=Roseivivax halodurans JCM 10272 TaxID=1449350 RepID=X7EIM7_9RHOB|nr:peptide deformylase [Roseivivax halodurans]ETX15740.1 N-formylmethionyl-tRNA deformylase [Roseivivax halodurans JCM 10272]